MNTRPPTSNLPTRYDDFLLAQICEDANGLRLSVLSALARMNVDPWEEATRLAGMPSAIAAKALTSTLEFAAGRRLTPSETKDLAARLVRLLPQRGACKNPVGPTTSTSKPGVQQNSYWWIWVGLAIAMSLNAEHHRATAPNVNSPASQSSAASPSNRGDANKGPVRTDRKMSPTGPAVPPQ